MINFNLKNFSLNDAVSLHYNDVRVGSGRGHSYLLSEVSAGLHRQAEDLERSEGICQRKLSSKKLLGSATSERDNHESEPSQKGFEENV